MVYNPLDTTDTMSASEDSQSYNQIENYSNSVEKIMTIRERTEAARGAYQETLRSHTGPMKTLRALKSAAQCFFSSRRVKNQQELHVATVAQTATKPEIEDSADKNIDERSAKVLDMQDELKAAGQTQNGEDAQAKPVASATKSTASINDPADSDTGVHNAKFLNMQAELKAVLKKRAGQTQNDEDAQAEPVAPATKSTASIDDQLTPDNGALLDNRAAHHKIKVRPPKRHPRPRNPRRR